MMPGTVDDHLSEATMQPFTEHNATDIVVASLVECKSKRFQQFMASVISHLHAVVREVEIPTAEWMTAIDFPHANRSDPPECDRVKSYTC